MKRAFQRLVARINDLLTLDGQHYLDGINNLRRELPQTAATVERTMGNAMSLLSLHEVLSHPFHDTIIPPEEKTLAIANGHAATPVTVTAPKDDTNITVAVRSGGRRTLTVARDETGRIAKLEEDYE